MDLELNFAAPPAKGGGGPSRRQSNNAGAAPVHWKERMKGQQSKRRQEKKQGKTATTTATTTNAKKDDRNIRDLSSQDASAGPSKPSPASTSAISKSATSSITPASSAKANERRILNQLDDGDENGEISRTAATSNATAKRQVISSLFSNLPKLQPRENATATKDAEGTAVPAILTPSNAPSMGDNFEAMPIRKELVAHLISKMALQHPTTIQKLAVPFLCDPASRKKDALLQAQTGSGKTLSYLLPIIQDLLQMSERFKEMGKPMERSVGTLAIVVVPTRELAAQIFEVASKLLGFASGEGASHRWITPGLLTGGAHRQHEKARLRKGIPLLIATPGRLLDHLEATKAFRIAGESIRVPADASRRRKSGANGADSDDEFAYEDQGYSGNSAANNDEDDAISSDEDFENMAKSRSHRRNGEASDRTPRTPPADPQLALRWLVLDEADRLMDMGFEPQISSIVKLLETRLDKRKAALVRASNRGAVSSRLSGQIDKHQHVAERRTILCSATVEEKVEKLAGIALKDPLLIKGDDENGAQSSKTNGENAAIESNTATKYAPPTQLSQFYSIISPKLRFVALVALLRQVLLSSSNKKKRQKILVFMSCTDSVDFHWNAMSGLHMGRDAAAEKKNDDSQSTEKKLASKSALLPGTPVYRLHGSLDLQTRLTSLKAFSSSTDESAVLFCTSVAARGLDVQDVNCVIQYDLPTEGGVNEYIHRVGRTARAGAQGQAWAFLLPSETGWVDWAEAGMQKSTEADAPKNVKLVERDVDGLLKVGFGGGDAREYETRATDVQMAFERWVSIDEANARLAKKAFSSHVRAYATHPSEEKQFFHVKNLHLGHLAKAFGLREAPAGIGGGGGQKGTKSISGKTAVEKVQVGRKRKRNQPAAAAAVMAAGEDSASEEERPNRKPQIPRSGRALDGKGLHGPKGTVRSDFNIAGTDAIEAMLNKKRRR